MMLGAKERIVLFGLLPAEGDVITLRSVKKLREDLAFSEQENAALKMTQTGNGGYQWDPSADAPVEIHIPAKLHDAIAGNLKRLDTEAKLTLDHLDLFDKFVKNGEP
jgi:hypothetical protein